VYVTSGGALSLEIFYFFCNLLQLCGNISPNPGPPMVKYPCGKCSKAVTARQRGIHSRCIIWHHAVCVGVSVAKYNALSDDAECPWYCPSCVVAINDSQPTDTSIASVMIENNYLTSVTKENGYHCCVLMLVVWFLNDLNFCAFDCSSV